MKSIEGKTVILRDFIESDIASRIRWETEENEWQQWDAPWEYEGLSEAERAAELEGYIKAMRTKLERLKACQDDAPRSGFQIVYKPTGEYIGWCNSYFIDGDCSYCDEPTEHTAIGIDIPVMAARGKGCAVEALTLFIDYLVANGISDIFTQTWSGNTRMIRLANKLGFYECKRKPGIRAVRGEKYDGLTFKLDFDKYNSIKENTHA